MSTMEGTFQASPAKVAIWLFIVSDALTFCALLVGYGFMRMLSPAWPIRTEIFDMRLITFMTFVLISSSALMAMAVSAAQNRRQSHAVGFLISTIARVESSF
jgi:cytochrome c oxidase subunit 3